jgi:hypothetical protein
MAINGPRSDCSKTNSAHSKSNETLEATVVSVNESNHRVMLVGKGVGLSKYLNPAGQRRKRPFRFRDEAAATQVAETFNSN